jgi:hypothetical protein
VGGRRQQEIFYFIIHFPIKAISLVHVPRRARTKTAGWKSWSDRKTGARKRCVKAVPSSLHLIFPARRRKGATRRFINRAGMAE